MNLTELREVAWISDAATKMPPRPLEVGGFEWQGNDRCRVLSPKMLRAKAEFLRRTDRPENR